MPSAPKIRFEPLTVKKVVADVTKKFYVTNLNKIADAGFPTTKGLLENQEDVLKVVKDQPAERQKGMMNAIFYALSDHPNTHKVTYYNYFQVLKGKDPKYVEHQKKEEEKKAAAPPAPAAPAKRKYTKTDKFYAQTRLKNKQKTPDEVAAEILAFQKEKRVKDKKKSEDKLKKLDEALQKRLKKIRDN